MIRKTYPEIRKELHTGDIVLFSRKNLLIFLWNKITKSKWSHVGMVIKSADTNQILLWESTTLKNLCDQFSKIARSGVQAVLLSQRVRTYKGNIAIRKLCNVDEEMRREMYENLIEFRKSVANKNFERNYWELLKAFIDVFDFKDLCNSSKRENWSSVFCSELVAGAYIRMGLLDKKKPPNEYTPKDFSSEGEELELLLGSSLGTEITLTFE